MLNTNGTFKKGNIPWNKGLTYSTGKRSDETRKRISDALRGKPKSQSHRDSISRAQLNLPDDVKVRKALAVSRVSKGNTYRKGQHWVAWNKGIHTGFKSGNYKGGITKIDRLIRRMFEYKQWRSDCFQRDNWTCQTCGRRGGYITVHHIKSFHNIIKENHIHDIVDAAKCAELWDRDNGVTLCEECHKLTDNYKGRSKGVKT